MNDELHDLEASLTALRPSAPDAALLHRLESSAGGTLAVLTPDEQRFEGMLSGFDPAAVSPELMASLEKIVSSTPFQVDEKIVMFTKAPVTGATVRRHRPWAAAAAVALLGGVSALLLPDAVNKPAGKIASGHNPALAAGNFTPAGFGRNVRETKDEGIIWKDNRPYRLMRITYMERVSFIDGQGKRAEIEQPRVEVVLVPEKMD